MRRRELMLISAFVLALPPVCPAQELRQVAPFSWFIGAILSAAVYGWLAAVSMGKNSKMDASSV